MSLSKDDINNTLKQESVKSLVKRDNKKKYKYVEITGVDAEGFEYTETRRIEIDVNDNNASIAAKAIKASEDSLVKTITLVGEKDGEIYGGVKSLGKDTIINGETVKNTSVSKLTDSVGSLTGTKTPSASLGSITGLPAQTAGDKASSSVEVVGAAGPSSIASSVSVAASKKNAAANDIASFASSIADAGESSLITSSIPNISFGSLEDTIKSVTPVGNISGKLNNLKDNLSAATGISALTPQSTGSKNFLSNFSDAGSVIRSGLTNVTSSINDFGKTLTEFISDTTKRFDVGLQSGFLQNIGETIGGNAKSSLANIVSGGIALNDDEYKKIFSELTAEDPKQKATAIGTIISKSPNVSDRMKGIVSRTKASNVSDLSTKVSAEARKQGIPENEILGFDNEIITIESGIDKLDTTIGGTFVVDADLFDEGISIGSVNQRWSGKTSGDDVFTYVSSVEELDTEFAKINRNVTEVIVHAFDTYTNKNIGAIEINNIHNELGHDGIGYHYVIRRDGRLQRGRPVNRKGEHAPVNGHDDFSIGIVMVGGLDSPSGSDNVRRSAGAFTRAQYTTLEQFLGGFYRKYPGGQVFGHSDVDQSEIDPYFDVIDYVDSIFRKKNVIADTLNSKSLPNSVIVQSVAVESLGRSIAFTETINELDGSAVINTKVIEPDGDIPKETEATLKDTTRPPVPKRSPDGVIPVPFTDPDDGTVYYYEWSDKDGEWQFVEDYSEYETDNRKPSVETKVYDN